MKNGDALIGNDTRDNSKFCLAKTGQFYLVYLPNGGTTELDLADASGEFTVHWFNPRAGGPLLTGTVSTVSASGKASLGQPPTDPDADWLVVVQAKPQSPIPR